MSEKQAPQTIPTADVLSYLKREGYNLVRKGPAFFHFEDIAKNRLEVPVSTWLTPAQVLKIIEYVDRHRLERGPDFSM